MPLKLCCTNHPLFSYDEPTCPFCDALNEITSLKRELARKDELYKSACKTSEQRRLEIIRLTGELKAMMDFCP